MATVLAQIDEAVPRTKENIAWRLVLVARYRRTCIDRHKDPGFMTWEDLAKIFEWSSGAALASHCWKKVGLASRNSGLQLINLLAIMAETMTKERQQLSEQTDYRVPQGQ